MGFRLDGLTYAPVIPEEDGSLFSEELRLKLIREDHMLRLADPKTGRLVPNVDEAVSMAEKEAQRAEEAERRADKEARKAAHLAAKLREMGLEPDSVQSNE